jgi:PhnB protein
MEKVTLDPYIFFAGNAREGMEFYQGIFGGELNVQTWGEVPDTDPAMKDKLMHAYLHGGDVSLMGADTLDSDKLGTGKITLSLTGDNEEKLRGYFDKLSDGGSVTAPLKKEFWGDTFGMLTDRYGVDWMVNIGAPSI